MRMYANVLSFEITDRVILKSLIDLYLSVIASILLPVAQNRTRSFLNITHRAKYLHAIEYTDVIKMQELYLILRDSKLLSGFPWSINGNPDKRLESACMFQIII
jgi:hypothetical protein